MGEIEKGGHLKSQNISIENYPRNTSIEKSHTGSVKISLFRMKKFEINKLMQYDTFFQWSVFEMSHFDSIKAKKLFNHFLPPKILLQHHLTPKNLV